MKRRDIMGLTKNAMGTVFLLAGAFFVCSTFLSMRAVFADPIAPVISPTVNANTASPRANSRSSRNNAALRARTTNNSVTSSASRASGASVSRANPSANVSRNVVPRASATPRSSASVQRNVVPRATASRSTATNQSRGVVARMQAGQATPSRVSLTGSAIRGNQAAAATNTYTYLSGKLYTGNYSNIIDSTTGLISAEAYQNCLESYYTCMDEICTARSAAQGRCACAARVKSFIQAEEALETANEELIKASGELALLIANKGKDISQAFQLTDAEKVMNCVSWQEANLKAHGTSGKVEWKIGGTTYDSGDDYMTAWCYAHSIYDDSCGIDISPKYCSSTGEGSNNFGFDISKMEGSGSDILATLQAWADSKDGTIKLLENNNDNLLNSFANVSHIVSGLTSAVYDDGSSKATLDNLANTWGYELFQYAHNNVCGRVLDSCFNGIYEACGTPPTVTVNNSTGGTTTTTLCANNERSNCPFNYNSKVAITAKGDVELNERGSGTASALSSATCFGYSTSTTTNGTTTTTDPYSSLRGPVGDARRSVMQKYLLDANAACDVYGDALKKTAQNIGYQKVAAQQALQQKRLEFKRNEENSVLSNATNAITNFTTCVDEIYDCYETMVSSHGPGSSSIWTAERVRTYCAQMSQVPHCYEDMVCNPSYAQFKAILDYADKDNCKFSQDYSENTCRNIVTLNEILNGAAGMNDVAEAATKVNNGKITEVTKSAALRELCLQEALGTSGTDYDPKKVKIRTWLKEVYNPQP